MLLKHQAVRDNFVKKISIESHLLKYCRKSLLVLSLFSLQVIYCETFRV